MSVIKQHWPLLSAGAAVLVGILIFCTELRWDGLAFNVKVTGIAGLLAPVAFAAAVVERAVEILISPWRDAGANNLQTALAAIQAGPDDGQKTSEVKTASEKLEAYRGATQQYAFAVSLVLSTCASIAGVRALEPFLDPGKFSDLSKSHPGQYFFFLGVDVALSAALLAGGADGVHSVVNAVTSFFDATADKTTKQTT
jgi:hypothetical protein